jgi:hypothetical protein
MRLAQATPSSQSKMMPGPVVSVVELVSVVVELESVVVELESVVVELESVVSAVVELESVLVVVPVVVEVVGSTMAVVSEALALPVPDSVAVAVEVGDEVGVGSSGPVEVGAGLPVVSPEVPVPVPATSSPQLEIERIADTDKPEMRGKFIAPGNHRRRPGVKVLKVGVGCIRKKAVERGMIAVRCVGVKICVVGGAVDGVDARRAGLERGAPVRWFAARSAANARGRGGRRSG